MWATKPRTSLIRVRTPPRIWHPRCDSAASSASHDACASVNTGHASPESEPARARELGRKRAAVDVEEEEEGAEADEKVAGKDRLWVRRLEDGEPCPTAARALLNRDFMGPRTPRGVLESGDARLGDCASATVVAREGDSEGRIIKAE